LLEKRENRKKSKRSRDKDDTPKKRSKKNKISDENQDELGTGEEEEAKPKEPNFFDDFISSLKAGKGKRKKDDIGIDQIETINDFKIKMDLAFEEDRAANQKGQPALSKLKMLGEVTEALDKKQLHTTYIENDLLPIIKKWLDPLPDRSLPNMKIRENLLRALMKFPPIDADELKDSGLGRVVMFLSKHPNETPQNKKVARMLIERWARPIFGIQEHFRADRDHEDEMEEESTQRKEERKRDSQSNSQLVDMENELNRRGSGAAVSSPSAKPGAISKDSPTFHARIPDKIALDFKIRPKSKINMEETKKKEKRKLEKHLVSNKVGKGSVIKRAVGVSIEGRGIVH